MAKDVDKIITNQIAIMEALVILMAHYDKPDLGPMDKTWQFKFLKDSIQRCREE